MEIVSPNVDLHWWSRACPDPMSDLTALSEDTIAIFHTLDHGSNKFNATSKPEEAFPTRFYLYYSPVIQASGVGSTLSCFARHFTRRFWIYCTPGINLESTYVQTIQPV